MQKHRYDISQHASNQSLIFSMAPTAEAISTAPTTKAVVVETTEAVVVEPTEAVLIS